jgi:hypothetical protein
VISLVTPVAYSVNLTEETATLLTDDAAAKPADATVEAVLKGIRKG